MEWISVSDRLPEPETDVLVVYGGNIEILTYRYNRRGHLYFMYQDDSGYWREVFSEPTYWMLLPEPPQN